MINKIKINFPRKLVFGNHCFQDFITYFTSLPYKNALIILDLNLLEEVGAINKKFSKANIDFYVYTKINTEPTIKQCREVIKFAKENSFDSIIGIGGGSVLDVAKLVAALCYSKSNLRSVLGIGKIKHRKLFLACLPTTSGTGSEMSPNAILLDENDNLKKGIISPFLVPDVTYVDPILTHTVPPPRVTAATGVDAFTHCIEAYANKFAHPFIDIYALAGIKLIYENLESAYIDGTNSEARANVALGSLYGGICLGPVNTAAVHALSYPLGGEYHIAHGESNAILLPHVLESNLDFGVERYANIARVIGVKDVGNPRQIAQKGIKRISELCRKVGIPNSLEEFDIPKSAVPNLAKSAMSVQRLLKNNLREFSEENIIEIYNKLF